MLNGIQVTAADDHPAMGSAARYVSTLADEIWDATPANLGEQGSTGVGAAVEPLR
jgi:hypothetical protein